MVVAKSNRRKRQDRVKVGAKRAEQARRRAKAEREQQAAERYRRLLDPRAGPADVAGILAAELPDSLAAGAMMAIRLSSGVPGEEIARTARLMLASATGPPRIGTLAVAAWAAHVTGDEDAERGYAGELLSRADAVDDPELRLEVIRAASARGHPGEACELIEPYLRGRPDDALAAGIYAGALAGAHAEAEPGERERAALARYGDRSGSEALREAIDAFLGRTEWGATVGKWADAERSRLEAEYWQAANATIRRASRRGCGHVSRGRRFRIPGCRRSCFWRRSGEHPVAGVRGGPAEALRLGSLLRQLEYQAGLAAARGGRPIDTEWLRTELGLTAPLSERLP